LLIPGPPKSISDRLLADRSGFGKEVRRSGKVDVVAQTGLSCTIEQPKQRRALVATGSAPDDNNDAMMCVRNCKLEEVVPIAGQEYATRLVSKAEHGLIGGILRKRFAQQHDFVAELFQQVTQVVGDVMIEQKLHDEGADICLATSKSISPRWSS
jgi:hypothetical protein